MGPNIDNLQPSIPYNYVIAYEVAVDAFDFSLVTFGDSVIDVRLGV
jgi:hypothetical protein